MSIRILQADARHLPLDDNTVNLVVTSPPYFGLRSYQDGGEHYDGQIGAEATPAAYVDNLLAVTRECMRVLKPTGSLWVNLGDKYSTGNSGQSGLAELGEQYRGGGHTDAKAKRRTGRATGFPPKTLLGIPWRYALACIDQLGLILRAEVIWAKPNGLPESVRDRVRRSHEQWFHFTLEPRYYSAVDEIREEYDFPGQPRTMGKSANGGLHSGDQHKRQDGGANPLGKLPGSVWTVATEPLKLPADLDVDHFAAFPTEHPFRIVRGWSPPDGVVLDPFGGTGTTAHVAHALGRHAIHNDMSADYNRIAAHPEVQAKRAAKVAKKLAARPAVADKPQQGELHTARLLLQHIAERP